MKKNSKAMVLASAALISMGVALADNHTTRQQQPSTPIETTKNFNAEQVRDIHEIIANYMVTHPQILKRSITALKAQVAKKKYDQTIIKIQKNKKDIFNNKSTPVMGNQKGNITVVEFLDYQCKHCKTASNSVNQLLQNNKNIRVIVKDFAIFGNNSALAAKASLYAKKQGKYKAFHHALINNKRGLNKDRIFEIAQTVGLNQEGLEDFLHNNANEIEMYMSNTRNLAEALGLTTMPAFIIANTDSNKYILKKGKIDEKGLKDAISQVQ